MNESELNNPVVLVKKCTNHIRGCRNILSEDYLKKKCEDCLRKDREADKRRREEAKLKQQSSTTENDINRVCTTCCKEYSIEHFQGLRQNTTTKTCKTCRENNKKQDAKRDKEHRNELAKQYSKKPEQIARKKVWVKNNYDKVAETWQRHRQKKIEDNVEEYLKKNSENAKKWRDTNPEKCQTNLENNKNNICYHYKTYKRSSVVRNIPFEITFEEFENIVKAPCYYCGEFTKNCSINGIDRTNFEYRYIANNCVSCCKICNMMKNTLNKYTFLKRIEHILTFQQLVHGQLRPELFCNFKGATFELYKYRAKDKNINFEITKDYFKHLLLDNKCYLCGKMNSSSHQNGLDRLDNNIGYTIDNCRVCCANCNYLKKDFPFDEFIRKLLLIYNNHKDDVFKDETISTYLISSDKLSKEELEKYREDQKNIRIENLKKRYTTEQIKMNAQLIAEKYKTNNPVV